MKRFGAFCGLLILAACVVPTTDDAASDGAAAPSPHGAGFFAWKGYVYALGGLDADGACRSEVWRAPVSADGELGTWVRDADLPEGLAFASCAAFGGMAYVVGGRNAGGPVSTVYYTLISPSDGSLGFSGGWETNPRSLPEGRCAAASLVLQGRIFLLGGETASGASPAVLSARFWNDGQVGQWYEASAALPVSGPGLAAAVHGGELWVAGGGAAYRAAPDANGVPSAWTAMALAAPASSPVLASTADGLLRVGGSGTAGYASTCLFDGSSWTAASAAVSGHGPHGVVTAARVLVLTTVRGSEAPTAAAVSLCTPRADAPRVSPADGIIPKGSTPRVAAYPGDTVRYTTAAYGVTPAVPTDSSPLWDSSSPPTVDGEESLSFRAFREGAEPSETVTVRYRVRSTSTFVMIQDTLVVQTGTGSACTCGLAETYSDGTSLAVDRVWYSVTTSRRSSLEVGWADASDDPSSYSARVLVSLFESDTYTPVRGTDGSEAYRMTGGQAAMILEAGTYYLSVESADGSVGGTFGLYVTGP